MSRRRENPLKPCALVFGLVALLAACAGVRQVETTPASDVMVLTPDYAILENLGPAPVAIVPDGNIARFRLERKKTAPEFLLVLFPDKLGGPVPLNLSDSAGGISSVVYGTYFDQLLRAHRLVLKGDLDAAEELVGRIQKRFDDGFGTSILLGNLALLRGDHAGAVQRFRFAKSLIPDAPVPPPLLPNAAEGGTP